MEMEREGEKQGERRMQSDAAHTEPNGDSSVSVATVEKLIAGAFFWVVVGGGGVPHLPGSALLCRPALVWPLFVVVAKEL